MQNFANEEVDSSVKCQSVKSQSVKGHLAKNVKGARANI
jgi:hypothetical protein